MVHAVPELKSVSLKHNVLHRIHQGNIISMKPEIHPLVVDCRPSPELFGNNAILRPQGQLQHEQAVDHVRGAQVKEQAGDIATGEYAADNLLRQSFAFAVFNSRIRVSAKLYEKQGQVQKEPSEGEGVG